jgi:hypothetical protein
MGALIFLIVVGLVVYYTGKRSVSCGVTMGILAAFFIIVWILINTTITVEGTLTAR